MTGYPQTYPHDGTEYRRTEKWFFHDGEDWKKARTVYKHDGTQWRRVFGKTATWKPLPGSSLIHGEPFIHNGQLFISNYTFNFTTGNYDGTGYAAKYNGVSWERIGTITGVRCLFAHGGSMYAISYLYPNTYLYIYTGSDFSLVESIANKDFIYGVSFSGVMALSKLYDNLLKKYNGLWETFAFGDYNSGQPNSIFKANEYGGALYTDGLRSDNGRVHLWNGSTWSSLASGTDLRFFGVFGGEITAYSPNNMNPIYSYSGGTWNQKGTLNRFNYRSGTFHESRFCAGRIYEVFAFVSTEWVQIGLLYDGVSFHGTPEFLTSFDGKLIVTFNGRTGAYFWDGDMP